MIDRSLKHSEYEFECSFKESLTVFNRIKKMCDKKYNPPSRTVKTLDIGFKNDIRATVSDATHISSICKTGYLKEAFIDILIQKTKVQASGVDTVDESRGDVRFRLRHEAHFEKSELTASDVKLSANHHHLSYRLKSRRTYTSPRGHRIELTVVKSAFKKRGESLLKPVRLVLEEPNTYEVEVEFNTSTIESNDDIDELIQDYADTLKSLLEVRYETPSWVPVERQQVIDEKLHNIVGSSFHVPIVKTLELPDVMTLDVDGYAATPKADGERVILVSDDEGRLYMTMPRREISRQSKRIWMDPCITIPAMKNSVLDAEYIKPTLVQKGLILVFDTYFSNGANICTKDLWSRVNEYVKGVDSVTYAEHSNVRIFAKNHTLLRNADRLFGPNNVLETSTYAVDGLVLTPINEPVPMFDITYDPRDDVDAGSSTRLVQRTWSMLFKWKQTETIDFVARFVGPPTSTHQNVTLCTTKMKYEPGPYYIQRDLRNIRVPDNDYTKLRPFIPPGENENFPNAVATVEGVSVVCENGDVVSDGTVVECAWRENAWVLLNVRPDKNVPNAYLTAQSSWRNIVHPISRESLLKREALEQIALDTYWRMDDVRSDDMENMRKYHRRVKDLLYETASKRLSRGGSRRPLKLLELACGKAGDMSSWLRYGYTYVVGVDLYADSIGNRQNGALVRWKQKLDETRNKHRSMYFLVGDCSKEVSSGDAALPNDEYHRNLFKELWTPNGQTFDVISIQFAIHYFFETEETWKGLRGNINANSKKGTLFVATCFDGIKVREFMKGAHDPDTGTSAYTWSIKPKFSQESASTSEYGNKITVFIPSINQSIDEYLVDATFLDSELKDIGFEPVENKMFESYKTLILPIRNKRTGRDEPVPEMNESERALSNLYRSYVYVKK